MKNLHVVLVIVLYVMFLIGVMLAMQFHPNGTSDLIFYSFLAVHFIMLFLITASIIMAILYLVVERSIKNVIVLLVSGVSVSWILVPVYAIGTIMSNF